MFHISDLLLPSLPPIDSFPASNAILWPIAQPSLLDATISEMLDLPAPIEPIVEAKPKRPVPKLISICDLIDLKSSEPQKDGQSGSDSSSAEIKVYPRSKRSSTSKFILSFLEDYEKRDVSNESISVSLGLNGSGEQFGQLEYSGESSGDSE